MGNRMDLQEAINVMERFCDKYTMFIADIRAFKIICAAAQRAAELQVRLDNCTLTLCGDCASFIDECATGEGFCNKNKKATWCESVPCEHFTDRARAELKVLKGRIATGELVEVVRCAECKRNGHCAIYENHLADNEFCSLGERS